LPPREQRYDRADEVLEACFALWNSWDADAFVCDKQAGVLADPSKVHYANYSGRWIRSRGPLSIPRSPQGRPVIMQAGSSDRGRDFAARWAEVVFTIQRGREEMREFHDDLKARMQARGRAPHECAILPAVSVVIGETPSIARERAAYLDSLIDPELSLAASSSNLGADLTKLGSDAALATLQGSQGNQGMQGSQDLLNQVMEAEGISFRQAAVERAEARELVGTPSMIADMLQETFEAGVCDGFVVAPTTFPGMLEQFCRSVVPELQRRGLFRTEYPGRTLRENLQA
jgi:FMN-dependent oxidoreductase (nitrilotriacetate monooxygenase family)